MAVKREATTDFMQEIQNHLNVDSKDQTDEDLIGENSNFSINDEDDESEELGRSMNLDVNEETKKDEALIKLNKFKKMMTITTRKRQI